MAFVRPKARILERTTTAGNGPYALAGAVDGSYNTFASFMAVGDTTYASVVEPGVGFWTGIVTYSATNQITLTTVEETKGTFGAGTKEIFSGLLASRVMQAEDASGAIVTGGSSTAYTVASYRKFDTLARMHGEIVAFSPHLANGQTVTLNVDGLGAKPLRPRPGYELQSNALIAGTPYTALYNHTDGVFYLHAFGGSDAPGILLGMGVDYWGSTAPSTAFAFPVGQAISRTTYAALFDLFGTTYGAGDGSTTFNLPDKSGRVSAMKEAAATRLTSTYFGGNSANLGAAGGSESHTLTTAQLAAHTHANSLTDPGHTHTIPNIAGVSAGTATVNAASGSTQSGSSTTGITITNASAGGGGAHNNVQPTIVCNYVLRVL